MLISAGFVSGRRATSPWGMLGDLRAVGVRCDPVERVVRDENAIMGIFPPGPACFVAVGAPGVR